MCNLAVHNTLGLMNTAIAIYQWVGLAFVVLGFGYGLFGFLRGDCPFVGVRKYSDSLVYRFVAAVGIAMVWPVFIPFVVLDALFGKGGQNRL